MLSRRSLLVVGGGWLMAACASSRSFSGGLDMRRVEEGKIWLSNLSLSCNRRMMRGVMLFDAPPDRVWNLFADVEAYPLWQQNLESIRVLQRDAEGADVEAVFKPFMGVRLSPARERVRMDQPRGELSISMHETDWARQLVNLVKLESYEGGQRTLMHGYASAELKTILGKVSWLNEEKMFTGMLENARRAVKMDRFARPPAAVAAGGATLGKVVIPSFRSSVLDEQVRQTLTRVFAQQLMQSAHWNVVTEDEMVALLDHARRRELAGCDVVEQCAVDLAGTLQADRLVHGTVGRVGNTFVVTASVMKLPEGKIEQRVEQQANGEDALVDAVRMMAEGLAVR